MKESNLVLCLTKYSMAHSKARNDFSKMGGRFLSMPGYSENLLSDSSLLANFKKHQIITIDGRNGTHLPKGTNLKIIDVAGNLVFETNVVEGEQLQGGKVIWDKKNLAGNPVSSGIYIVLLSNDDASETSITKIAIVN